AVEESTGFRTGSTGSMTVHRAGPCIPRPSASGLGVPRDATNPSIATRDRSIGASDRAEFPGTCWLAVLLRTTHERAAVPGPRVTTTFWSLLLPAWGPAQAAESARPYRDSFGSIHAILHGRSYWTPLGRAPGLFIDENDDAPDLVLVLGFRRTRS